MEYIQENPSLRARAWIEIDRAALRNNVSVLRSRLPEGCALMPAVKANAYGHGAELIVSELSRMGIHDFCVATAMEGVEVRSLSGRGTVLVLGYTDPAQFNSLTVFELSQAAVDLDYARALAGSGRYIRTHLAVDTGMHRLGEGFDSYGRIAEALSLEGITAEGVFTHLCCSESAGAEDAEFTRLQLERFDALRRHLRAEGFAGLKFHALNSGGILACPGYGGDFVRPGIALYGMLGTEEDTLRLGGGLQSVLSLRARIAAVKTVPAGEGAGYGLAFRAGRESTLAVLTIGYADGLPRSLSEGVGRVLVNGHSAPIVGRICMDQTLVDVTGIPDVHPGGTATVIGRDGEQCVSACEIARRCGTISNEILSRLSERLERVVTQA